MRPRRRTRARHRAPRLLLTLIAAFGLVLGLSATSATSDTGARTTAAHKSAKPEKDVAPKAAQVLTWTAGDDITHYVSAPEKAVAGPATIVFENSKDTGNTSGMPHTLT
ncbi:glycosyl hydrolase, partial [Streptomyces sp. SID11233]|nr:glycosyl hydrolase [Streptomyces sp. SID11233]